VENKNLIRIIISGWCDIDAIFECGGGGVKI